MSQIDINNARRLLGAFDFEALFIEELGWAHSKRRPVVAEVDGQKYKFLGIAEQGGMEVLSVVRVNRGFPDKTDRQKVDRFVTKSFAHEHILIYVDSEQQKAVWQWVKRSKGSSDLVREHTYIRGQNGEALLQKLNGIAFEMADLDEEGQVGIGEVTARTAKAFDVERVTKRFYVGFKDEHTNFLKFLEGIDDSSDRAWYTSVMLNRLMFVYFIQKKGFLGGDHDYLARKLEESRKIGKDRFYREFLVALFFEGFAKEEADRSEKGRKLLGRVPYLNGGLFETHPIEARYGQRIRIPDLVFKKLFEFFDAYQWHLDDRPLRADNEINPDVLGYIFEKYVNQKQMGAYYTKEDITGYICRNTILPFLFRKLQQRFPQMGLTLRGSDLDRLLPAGITQSDQLPGETERDFVVRTHYLGELHKRLESGEVFGLNDTVTINLDIERFAREWLSGLADPQVLEFFYFECLQKITVLDPTVGSGAFLFAAMNILEPLYELCLSKMSSHASSVAAFKMELDRVAQHPNQRYFTFKSIVVNNLYGVDLMAEAAEICKLRLFLKLVSQIDDETRIEPLPDIDFNIRAGNSLVGYASLEDVQRAAQRSIFNLDLPNRIAIADSSLREYRALQTAKGVTSGELAKAKARTKEVLESVRAELNESLRLEYGARDLTKFVHSHQPFHWYVEFNRIVQAGGFDVIVGNPPYLELSEIDYLPRGFLASESRAVHAICIERSLDLLSTDGAISMIVPLSLVSTQRMKMIQTMIENRRDSWYANFSWRPGKLFDTVNRALTIFVALPHPDDRQPRTYSTDYQKWNTQQRDWLMELIRFTEVDRNRVGAWVPKLGDKVETQILRKVLSVDTTIGNFVGGHANPIYYRTTGGLYWKVFTDFPPKFSVNGKPGHSTRETQLYVPRPGQVKPLIAILSSCLYWWWYTITSNCRDLNPYDILNFPAPASALDDRKLAMLGDRYLTSIKENSVPMIRVQKQTGRTETQSFRISASKSIIDDIDRELGKHYHLSAHEIDFLANYDVKYRMSKEEDEA